MITVSGLKKGLGGVPVLRGIDLDVGAGEVLALIGSSGSGKSVLLKHIVGLLEPDAGDVVVDRRSVSRANHRELAEIRKTMGYVFQDGALLDSLNVRDNLRLALSDPDWYEDRTGSEVRIEAAIAAVNLDDSVLNKLPTELSGGMRKRVGVARAIIHRPHTILYDEPTTGLDPRNVVAIDELVLRNRDRFGATSVVITHDMTSVHRIADRVALLADGKVQFLGTPLALIESDEPAVRNFLFSPGRKLEHVQPWA
jgi:phospholipid/cholesterol/gamma-HCH transport system ATP-binding protein